MEWDLWGGVILTRSSSFSPMQWISHFVILLGSTEADGRWMSESNTTHQPHLKLLTGLHPLAAWIWPWTTTSMALHQPKPLALRRGSKVTSDISLGKKSPRLMSLGSWLQNKAFIRLLQMTRKPVMTMAPSCMQSPRLLYTADPFQSVFTSSQVCPSRGLYPVQRHRDMAERQRPRRSLRKDWYPRLSGS